MTARTPATPRLTDANSAVALYREFYGPRGTTATTHMNQNIVIRLLESILSADKAQPRSATAGATLLLDRYGRDGASGLGRR